jgi:hypothetical protein
MQFGTGILNIYIYIYVSILSELCENQLCVGVSVFLYRFHNSTDCALCENRCTKSHTSPETVNKILSYFPFFLRFILFFSLEKIFAII